MLISLDPHVPVLIVLSMTLNCWIRTSEPREYPAHCQKPLTCQISDSKKLQSLIIQRPPTAASLILNIKASAKMYRDFIQTLVRLARAKLVDEKRNIRLKSSIEA
jgi:hypothetical protein